MAKAEREITVINLIQWQGWHKIDNKDLILMAKAESEINIGNL